jgi:dipeptidyl aminopeptidase/acylaminoacyl peptidase
MFVRSFSLSILIVLLGMAAAARADEHFISKEVEYKTEDGWTISATLRLPPGASRNNEFAGMLRIATLAIDWRGREKSMGEGQPIPDELHDFSTKMREQMYLDVTGALHFMADYPGVDRLRIGVLASQFSAEPAVRGIRETASS